MAQITVKTVDNAFKFIDMFFGEISEVYPKSKYAEAVSRLSWIIGNDAVEVSENLASISRL